MPYKSGYRGGDLGCGGGSDGTEPFRLKPDIYVIIEIVQVNEANGQNRMLTFLDKFHTKALERGRGGRREREKGGNEKWEEREEDRGNND